MRFFAESNFVLSWALGQEEADAIEDAVAAAEAGRIELVLPALALFEPYYTLVGRRQARADLRDRAEGHLKEIARSRLHAEAAEAVRTQLRELFVEASDRSLRQLRAFESRVLGCTRILPIDAPTFVRAGSLGDRLGLELPDALVLASVLADLEQRPAASVFANANSRDFNDPDIVAELRGLDCRLIPRFTDALAYATTQR